MDHVQEIDDIWMLQGLEELDLADSGDWKALLLSAIQYFLQGYIPSRLFVCRPIYLPLCKMMDEKTMQIPKSALANLVLDIKVSQGRTAYKGTPDAELEPFRASNLGIFSVGPTGQLPLFLQIFIITDTHSRGSGGFGMGGRDNVFPN
jgi:hypothetical protein